MQKLVITGGVGDDAPFKTGDYQFLQVPPGAYLLSIEKPGFSVSTQQDVQLLVNTPATLNVAMQLARLQPRSTWKRKSPRSIRWMRRSAMLSIKTRCGELPLQTRNVVELLSLQPGVTQTGEVLGSRRDQNNITLDGVDANDNQNAGLGVLGRNCALRFRGLTGKVSTRFRI